MFDIDNPPTAQELKRIDKAFKNKIILTLLPAVVIAIIAIYIRFNSHSWFFEIFCLFVIYLLVWPFVFFRGTDFHINSHIQAVVSNDDLKLLITMRDKYPTINKYIQKVIDQNRKVTIAELQFLKSEIPKIENTATARKLYDSAPK